MGKGQRGLQRWGKTRGGQPTIIKIMTLYELLQDHRFIIMAFAKQQNLGMTTALILLLALQKYLLFSTIVLHTGNRCVAVQS